VCVQDLSFTVTYLEHFKSTVTTSNTSTKCVLPSIYEKLDIMSTVDVMQPSEKID